MSTAFCFDLDGTLTARELLPVIAAETGLQAEIEALTLATITGILPFESSFRLRCRLLADVPVSRVRAIVADLPLFGRILDFIRARPDDCYVITGNLDVWVEDLLGRIGARAFSSSALVRNDRLAGVTGVLDKGAAVQVVRRNHSRIVAIGDGVGDLAMFENSDVRIAYAGLHAPVPTLVASADMVCMSETALIRTLEAMA
jgi:HAD superfamily phosphoserine phosphatase-like hydrolase